MRPVIVAGNWKMHTTPADAGELARTIGARTRVDGVTRVLCPPYVCLAAVRDALAGPDVAAPDGTGVAASTPTATPSSAARGPNPSTVSRTTRAASSGRGRSVNGYCPLA